MTKKIRRARLINTSRQKAESAIRVGDEFESRVRGLSETGNAVLDHPCGQVVFAQGLWLDELARLRIVNVKKSYAEASVVELLESSPARREAPCRLHGFGDGLCGGCSWMFVDYSAQLQAKQQRAEYAIKKLQADAPIAPIIPSENTLAYRRRAQFKSDGEKLGFTALGQHQIVDVETCLVLDEQNQAALTELRKTLPNSDWASAKKDYWTTIDVDESGVSVNKRLPFQQVNAEQNRAMHHWLMGRLGTLDGNNKMVELFAGSGNLTEVAHSAGFIDIVAVEAVTEAIEQLNQRNLPGVVGEICNLFDEKQFEQFWQRHADAHTLLLDPPREGLKVTKGLFSKKVKLRDVVYISCDLATLCRDLKIFMDNGYKLMNVQPLDMFPQTPHLEMLVHLRRR